MRSVGTYLAVVVLSFAIGGCETLRHPMAPQQSFDTDEDIKQLEEEFGKASAIKQYYAGPQTVERRNRFITGRLALINLHYIQFIRKLAAEKAQLNTAMDVMQLGIDLAASVVGGAPVKAALAAASAGITGTRTSIDKNFFFEQTVPALITAMNAQRKEALVPIIRGLNASLKDYPFAQAVTDLEAYYFAGTFVGGLQAIQKDAGKKEAEKDEEIEKVLTIQRKAGFLAPDAVDRVQRIIKKIQTLSDNDAIALSKNPPTQDPNSEIAVREQDPNNRRFTEGKAAKMTLVTRAREDARTEGNLAAWERALGL